MNRTEFLCVLLIIVSIAASTYHIITVAYNYKPRELTVSTYSTPEIPQCDKELWDRIIEGCND